jgi:NADP-dependent 3-hydroxy acid dehydrogenase YdfG
MTRLLDKVALVTGGSSGIGLAVARTFLAEGARVAIMGRSDTKLQAATLQLEGGDRLVSECADVAELSQVQKVVDAIGRQWGPVEILVNNAGVNTKRRAFRELTAETWQRLLRTNLDGAFYCIHAVLPGMLARKEGVIVNINSIAGIRASPVSGAAYAASKFGMRALGLCLAAEERESGIRVHNIMPGEVDTPILEERPQPVTTEQRLKILKPEDVAAAVLFVTTLPQHVSVPELVIKPAAHVWI